MKKIIRGKKYDTETAKYICSFDVNTDQGTRHIYYGDFCYWRRSLYLKTTGEYFIFNENLCRSADYEHINEIIEPLGSIDDAKRFAEKCDHFSRKDEDTYHDFESVFGEVPE